MDTFGISVPLLRSAAFSRNCPVEFPHPQRLTSSLAATDWARGVSIWHEAGQSDILSQKFGIRTQRERWLEL